MKTILCYGDSNTWGYDAESDSRIPWDKRYPGILSRKLGAAYHVIEDGLCGRTTHYDSEEELFVNGLKGARLCAEIHSPLDYVVLMLGTNDCKDVYRAQIREIQEGARQIGHCFAQKGAQILLMAPPVMRYLKKSPFFKEFGEGAGQKSSLLSAAYQELSRQEGWLFLNADDVVRPGEYDWIHLDEEGHRILAEKIYEILKKEED
ncbi:GDSL-type esterase/lipase family protein [Roseburia hominis]